MVACAGNKADNTAESASSKSAKSNPGETVQPTKEKRPPLAVSEANQAPAGTIAWQVEPWLSWLSNSNKA